MRTVSRSILEYPKYWAECFGTAPFLPTSRKEMDDLGWDSCDVVLVTGDAYVDLPSFGMAVVGRFLEAQGFRVGIIDQPDWQSKDAFMALGKPNLFFSVTAGNMDSMVNRYTSDRKLRHDDAYSPNNEGGRRPDRAVLVYSQRCREAYKDVPLIIGGIEASLRRLAHYDYWSDKIRRSVLFDARADMLMFGNSERSLAEVAHRLAQGEDIATIKDVEGTAVIIKQVPEAFRQIDSTRIEKPGPKMAMPNPYEGKTSCKKKPQPEVQSVQVRPVSRDLAYTVVRLPSYEKLKNDRILYAHASRVMHLEINPYSARALVQQHGDRELWVNPPTLPLSTAEIDYVFGLPFARRPHPKYGKVKIPAYEMIKTSINIMRGCFGGCSFCSITEHEGRIIQSRSQESIINEIKDIRDKVPGFTGTISDLGGPSANMYRLGCNDPKAEANCRHPSCIFPKICNKLDTNHKPLINLYRAARKVKGVKNIMVASGVRYDLAVESPEYVRELATNHVGGYLKIAPEHTEKKTLDLMMKPGMDSYYRFKQMFDKASREVGKKQYIIPYFISAHPGTTDEDMLNLALWLKQNDYKCDQVQNFYPTPMSNATAMYHAETSPLQRVTYRKRTPLFVAKGERQRRLHKALLRYHDPANWPLLRKALQEMGKGYLIDNQPHCLIPPEESGKRVAGRKPGQNQRVGVKPGRSGRFATKHTVSAADTDRRTKKGRIQKKPKTN